MSRRLSFSAFAFTLAASVASTAAAAETPLTVDECFNALNEFAAAVVFSDLPEETAEKVYGLLDRLQDHCDASQPVEARQTIEEIEAILGK